MTTRQLKLISQRAMSIPEASGVASLGAGWFLVVDDQRGVFAVSQEGGRRRLTEGCDEHDPEGIALTPDRRSVLVLSERTGRLSRYQVVMKSSGPELQGSQHAGTLPELNKKKNRGWEGIAVTHKVPWSEDGQLVAVHQAKPRRLAIFPLPDPGEEPTALEPLATWRPPKELRDTLSHLNDVTVQPESGHVFLLSGRAALVVEVAVRRKGSKLHFDLANLHELPPTKGVPEGLTFSEDGTLWAVTDGAGLLLELQLRG